MSGPIRLELAIEIDPAQLTPKWESTLGNDRYRYSTFEMRGGSLLCELYSAGLGRSELSYYLLIDTTKILLGRDHGAAADRGPEVAIERVEELARQWVDDRNAVVASPA